MPALNNFKHLNMSVAKVIILKSGGEVRVAKVVTIHNDLHNEGIYK